MYIAIPSTFDASLCNTHTIIWRQPMATSPLHFSIIRSLISSITRPLHLPNMQQSILKTIESQNPLSFAHGREAIQVPSSRLRKSI